MEQLLILWAQKINTLPAFAIANEIGIRGMEKLYFRFVGLLYGRGKIEIRIHMKQTLLYKLSQSGVCFSFVLVVIKG